MAAHEDMRKRKKNTDYRIINPSSISFVGFFTSYALFHSVFCTSSVSLFSFVLSRLVFPSLFSSFTLFRAGFIICAAFIHIRLECFCSILIVGSCYSENFIVFTLQQCYIFHHIFSNELSLLLLLLTCNVHNGFVLHVLYIKYARNLFAQVFCNISFTMHSMSATCCWLHCMHLYASTSFTYYNQMQLYSHHFHENHAMIDKGAQRKIPVENDTRKYETFILLLATHVRVLYVF